jgi:hypothetical protein
VVLFTATLPELSDCVSKPHPVITEAIIPATKTNPILVILFISYLFLRVIFFPFPARTFSGNAGRTYRQTDKQAVPEDGLLNGFTRMRF